MADKEVGTQASLPGKLYAIGFYVLSKKEPDFTMMLMPTYVQLVLLEGKNKNVRMVGVSNANGTGTNNQVHSKYTEIFSNHYKFRGAVDDHNKKRHGGDYDNGISLETTWRTTRC